MLDAATAQALRELVAKGAMPPLVLVVDDCRAAYDAHARRAGVEFTQEPVDRYGSVDASFRDPSGNGWKMIEARSDVHSPSSAESGASLASTAIPRGRVDSAAPSLAGDRLHPDRARQLSGGGGGTRPRGLPIRRFRRCP